MALSDHIKKDTPTNNFATLNPLDDDFNSSVKFTYGEGNSKVSYSFTGTAFQYVFGSLAIPSNSTQKYYWEWTYNDINNNAQHHVGICASDSNQYTPSARTTGTAKEANVGTLRYHSTSQPPYLRYVTLSSATSEGTQIGTMSTSATYNNLSVLSLMYDAGAGKLYGWLNGEELAGQTLSTNTSLWDTFDTSKTYMMMLFEGDGGVSTKNGWIYLNFGQDPTFGGTKTSANGAGGYTTDGTDETGGAFFYQPPAGAKALCTANLEDITPDVDDDVPSDYMRPVVISGTNADNNNVSVGFQPDLCWLKKRNGASGHMIVDSVRGAGYALQSDNTGQEGTYNIANDFKEFTSTGFNLGAVSAYGSSNPSGTNNIIAWCWKAAGSPANDGDANIINENGTQADTTCAALAGAATSAGASNVITPSKVSANRKSGFSIIKYEGNSPTSSESYTSTLPHGLSKTPEFFIIKGLSGSGTTGTGSSFNMTSGAGWLVYHVSTGLQYSRLDDTSASATSTNIFKGVGSSYITIGVDSWLNCSDVNYIMYAFTSIPGYSAFGSYLGSSDLPFVYTGFKPALVICKTYNYATTSHTSWTMFDNSRDPNNVMNTPLYANLSVQEGYRGDGTTPSTGIYIDFVSNGFKIRSTQTEHNSNLDSIIYVAFAEQPIKYATAR